MPAVKRILVVKLSALGDLFHAMPIAHSLSAHYGCKVDWVTQPEYLSLVSCHRDVDRVLAYPRRGGLREMLAFRRQLRERCYDLALDLQGLTKSGLVLGFSRAERKIGFSRPRELAGWFSKETPPARAESRHALECLQDSLLYLGVETEPVGYPLDFPLVPELPDAGKPLVALAPKSRWPAKDWPQEKFAELGKRLVEIHGASVWILGGPDDQGVGAQLEAEIGETCRNLCGKHPLLALGPLLREVNCLVSNDSGPMHFAAALGVPLVALFGPTDPGLTGPVGEKCQVLRPPPGPEGYPDHRSYKHGDNGFIAELSVDQVFSAVESQIRPAVA